MRARLAARPASAAKPIVVEGGLDAWRKAGLPTEVDRRQPIELQRQVQIGAGGLVLLGAVLGARGLALVLRVPAFVGAGLMFAGVTGYLRHGARAARAPWNRPAQPRSAIDRPQLIGAMRGHVRALLQDALGVLSGSLVGFSLGLVGGGGSILAVPLLVYLVGVPSAHVAIGTSAVAVAVNAAANLVAPCARRHGEMALRRWSSPAAGVLGAFGGSSLGKIDRRPEAAGAVRRADDRRRRPDAAAARPARRRRVRLSRENVPWLLGLGLRGRRRCRASSASAAAFSSCPA